MKLLVFAHVPPPHHGQSYMVQLMLEGFGGDQQQTSGKPQAAMHGIECYHVNAQVSDKLEDIGQAGIGKVLRLLKYCLAAIWCRFRYNVRNFYYIPAPGKRSALYRDWIVMALCRPFYKRVIFHWHATGLGEWLQQSAKPWERAISYKLLAGADLSIVLTNFNRADAAKLKPRRMQVVTNGIPDPCPDFAETVQPRRVARRRAREKLLRGEPLTERGTAAAGSEPDKFKVLYLGHCAEEKGLFDALSAARLASRDIPAPLALQLIVAGTFPTERDEAEFKKQAASPDLSRIVSYVGFVSGKKKRELFEQSDCFCFPSHWDNCPVVVLEALAFDLPIIATRTNGVPELFPQDYPYLINIADPASIALSLVRIASGAHLSGLRDHFLARYQLASYLRALKSALLSAD